MMAQTKLSSFDYLQEDTESMTQLEAVETWSNSLITKLTEINQQLDRTLEFRMKTVNFAFIEGIKG